LVFIDFYEFSTGKLFYYGKKSTNYTKKYEILNHNVRSFAPFRIPRRFADKRALFLRDKCFSYGKSWRKTPRLKREAF